MLLTNGTSHEVRTYALCEQWVHTEEEEGLINAITRRYGFAEMGRNGSISGGEGKEGQWRR